MISEKDSFCATVNGIYKVLNNFYEARKPATKPTDPDAMQIDSDCSESELEPSSDSDDSDYNGRKMPKNAKPEAWNNR